MVGDDPATPPASGCSLAGPDSVDRHGLAGKRIFLVEDEFFLGLAPEEALRSAGCVTLGPFANLATAMAAARREQFDVAILDINLGGQMAYPLADDLVARAIPLIFLTGYGASHMPERFRTLPRLSKPFEPMPLVQEIRRVLRTG